MSGDPSEPVAAVGRLIARAGLVQAFGHVSARAGEGFRLTPTTPLRDARAGAVLELDAAGTVRRGEHCPIEAPLHAAIYRARPDVGAVCRTHSPAVASWACRPADLPLVHGLGGLSGRVVRHGSSQLLADAAAADAAAGSLGDADCLLLLANGAVCTGRDLPEATVRAWFLEERARIALHAPDALPLDGEALATRSRHFEAERRRAWHWLTAHFGDAVAAVSPTHDLEDRP